MRLHNPVFALILLAISGAVASSAPPDQEEPLELNTVLMQSTFKIEGPNSLGTAFILGRPLAKDPKSGAHVLITAAHVLETMQGDTATLWLRRPEEGGSWRRLAWPLRIRSAELQLWTKHPDADIAVMYIDLPAGLKIPLLPTTLLADDEGISTIEIHPGDELFCLGYPFGAESNPAGFPILRSGKIASYPLLPTRETKMFLLDFPIFRGNSGGPVYFVGGARADSRGLQIGVPQLIMGLVLEEKVLTETIEQLYERRERRYSLGLATIVHASLIREAINLLPPPDQVP